MATLDRRSLRLWDLPTPCILGCAVLDRRCQLGRLQRGVVHVRLTSYVRGPDGPRKTGIGGLSRVPSGKSCIPGRVSHMPSGLSRMAKSLRTTGTIQCARNTVQRSATRLRKGITVHAFPALGTGHPKWRVPGGSQPVRLRLLRATTSPSHLHQSCLKCLALNDRSRSSLARPTPSQVVDQCGARFSAAPPRGIRAPRHRPRPSSTFPTPT